MKASFQNTARQRREMKCNHPQGDVKCNGDSETLKILRKIPSPQKRWELRKMLWQQCAPEPPHISKRDI